MKRQQLIQILSCIQILSVVTVVVLLWELQQIEIVFHITSLVPAGIDTYVIAESLEYQIINLDFRMIIIPLVISIIPRLVTIRYSQYHYGIIIMDLVLLFQAMMLYIHFSTVLHINLSAIYLSLVTPFNGLSVGHIAGLKGFIDQFLLIFGLLLLNTILTVIGWYVSIDFETIKRKIVLDLILLYFGIILLETSMVLFGFFIRNSQFWGLSVWDPHIILFVFGIVFFIIGWWLHFVLNHLYQTIYQRLSSTQNSRSQSSDKYERVIALLELSGMKQILSSLILFLLVFVVYITNQTDNSLVGSLDFLPYFLIFMPPITLAVMFTIFDSNFVKSSYGSTAFKLLLLVMLIMSTLILPMVTQNTGNIGEEEYLDLRNEFNGERLNVTAINGTYIQNRNLALSADNAQEVVYLYFQSIAIITVVNTEIRLDSCHNITSIRIPTIDADISKGYDGDKITVSFTIVSYPKFSVNIIFNVNSTMPDLLEHQYYAIADWKDISCELRSVPTEYPST